MFLRYRKEILRAPVDILRNLYLYRHMLRQMVINEIKGKFAGSFGGLLWHFAHPILMLLSYLFVFVYIFNLRVSATAGAGASAIYIMAGLFPWIIMSEGLSRGTVSITENASLVQKTPFPTEILPAKAVIAPILSYGTALLLLALYKIVVSRTFSIPLILPVILLLQVLFTMGVVFLSTALTVFFRDIIQLVQVLISFWIYLTPILYPISMLPEWAKPFMYFNPAYPFMAVYQSLFVSNSDIQLNMLLLAFAWSLLFFIAGAFIFNKLKYEFADWL